MAGEYHIGNTAIEHFHHTETSIAQLCQYLQRVFEFLDMVHKTFYCLILTSFCSHLMSLPFRTLYFSNRVLINSRNIVSLCNHAFALIHPLPRKLVPMAILYSFKTNSNDNSFRKPSMFVLLHSFLRNFSTLTYFCWCIYNKELICFYCSSPVDCEKSLRVRAMCSSKVGKCFL